MKKIMMVFTMVFIAVFTMFFTSSVKAYNEQAFTDPECITDNSWQSSVTTDYKFDSTNGVFELSGTTYANSDKNSTHIYYGINNEGTLLYGYVPNYANSMADNTIKAEINNKGVLTTDNCAATLRVVKDIEGVSYPDSSSNPNDSNANSSSTNENNSNTTNSNTNNSNTNTNSGTDNSNDNLATLDSPNTASFGTPLYIVTGLLFFLLAAYVILKIKKPELFKKNK